ncbi:15903_t:CDS:1, partial [Acaulospora colombiana]
FYPRSASQRTNYELVEKIQGFTMSNSMLFPNIIITFPEVNLRIHD